MENIGNYFLTFLILLLTTLILHDYKAQYQENQAKRNLTEHQKMMISGYGNIENF